MTEMLTQKYRPTQWKEVVGQSAVVRSMRSVLEKRSNRTFLLSGPSGCGKTTIARIAAKEIGCEESDVTEVNAAHFTGVDDMRDIVKTIGYKPLSGRPRAFIIDECHRLTGNAWDSILKPLEEPPEWIWWYLCTTNPSKVPQTIQTRASHYKVELVSVSALLDMLDVIAESENLKIGADDDDQADILELCAKKAGGSPRQAVVNLATVASVQDFTEAKQLLSEVESSQAAIDLARLLMGRPSWTKITELIAHLKDEQAESVRHVVRAYMTKVILNPKTRAPEKYLAILEAFSTPFYQSEGMSPLVLACGKLLFSDNE